MNDPLLVLLFAHPPSLAERVFFFSSFSLALTQQSSVAADDAARNVREMEETCMMAVLHFDQAVKVDPVRKNKHRKIVSCARTFAGLFC